MANDRGHFVSGVIHHHVRTHLCLGLGAGTDVRFELCFEGHLLNPTIGSFLLEDAVQMSLSLDPFGSNGENPEIPSFRFDTVHSRTKLPFRFEASAAPPTHQT